MKPEADITEKIRSAIKAKLGQIGAYVDDELPDYIMVMIANKKSVEQIQDDLSLFLGTKTQRFTDWLDKLLRKLQAVDGQDEKTEKKNSEKDKHGAKKEKTGQKESTKHGKIEDENKKRDSRKRRSDEMSRSKDGETDSACKPSTSNDAPIEDAIEIQQQDNAEFEEVVKSASKPAQEASVRVKLEPASDIEGGKVRVTNQRKLIKTSTGENVPIRKVRQELIRETRHRPRRRYGAVTSVVASVNLRPESETETDDEEDYRCSGRVNVVRRARPYRADDKLVMRACREATSSVEADQARYHARRGDYLHWRYDDVCPHPDTRYSHLPPLHLASRGQLAPRGYPAPRGQLERLAQMEARRNARFAAAMRNDLDAPRPPIHPPEKPAPIPAKMVATATQTSPLPTSSKKRAVSKTRKLAPAATPAKTLVKKKTKTPVTKRPVIKTKTKVKVKPRLVQQMKEKMQEEAVKKLSEIVDDQPCVSGGESEDLESLKSYTSEEGKTEQVEVKPAPNNYDYDERRTLEYAKQRQNAPKRRLSDEFPASNKGPPSPQHLVPLTSSNVSRDLSDSDVEEVSDSRKVEYDEVYDSKYKPTSPLDQESNDSTGLVIQEHDHTADTKFIVTLDGIPPPDVIPSVMTSHKRQSPQTVSEDVPPMTSTPLDNKRHSWGDSGEEAAQPVTPIPNPDTKTHDKIGKSLDELIADKQSCRSRCKFWPACKNATDCPFVHPSVPCHMFPKCSFGSRCLYIHPNCRYDANCVNADCPYMHSSKRDPVTLAAAKIIKSIPKQPFIQGLGGQECKFYPNCFNTKCPFPHPAECRYGAECRNRSNGCPFTHPQLDMPNVDRFKWCNNDKFVISPLDTSLP